MDDNNNNIFEVLESPSSTMTLRHSSKATTERMSLRRSQLPLINGENGTRPSTSSPNGRARRKRRDRTLEDLGFANPGPKNLVNVANVPSRRLKTRQSSSQDKPSSSKPMYDKSGLFVSDQTDRCDCNRLNCPGCFLPCSSCQSSKCGLECRNLRTYAYEYRLYGTNKEILQE